MNSGFFQVANELPQNKLKEIGPTAFSVFMYLASMSDLDGKCFPGIEYIAQNTGISRGSVIKAIKILKSHKMLKVENHRIHSNLYTVPKDKSSNIVLSTGLKVQNLYYESINSELLKVQNLYPNNTQDNNTQKNNTEGAASAAHPEPPPDSKPAKKPKSDSRVTDIRSHYISHQRKLGDYVPNYGKLGKLIKQLLKSFDEEDRSDEAVGLIKSRLDIYFSLNGFYRKRRYPFEAFVSEFNAIGNSGEITTDQIDTRWLKK